MKQPDVYDVAGIGIGPFNLGLAALADPIPDLNCIFFDVRPQFSWHEGMLLPFAKMQVPFLADLVTGADPTSRFSYLSYLKQTNQLYQFAILDDHYLLRREYLAYCRWVADQLPNLYFNHWVENIHYDTANHHYVLHVVTAGNRITVLARHLVIGVGSLPFIPQHLSLPSGSYIHSAVYLQNKTALLQQSSVTIIGAGQSAAEIFYDLLQENDHNISQLNWCTRSSRFHPMETAKLTQEMTTPDYIRYFHNLSSSQKDKVLKGQQHLYKGIDADLIAAIYQSLYRGRDSKIKCTLFNSCELLEVESEAEKYKLTFGHLEMEQEFSIISGGIVLATGYQSHTPVFLEGIKERIRWDSQSRYAVNLQYAIDLNGNEIFVQNAEMHTHGFNTPDLGMGPYRNAVILNTLLGYTHYKTEIGITFQHFNPTSNAA